MDVEAASSVIGNSGSTAVAILITLAAVLILFVTITMMSSTWGGGGNGKLPPSPPGLPLLGHLHLIRPPPHQAFDRLVRRYGPLVYLRMGPSNHAVVVGSAEAARDFLRAEASIPQRGHSAVTSLLAYGTAGFAFAPYGAQWRFMKRLCMSELLGTRTLDLLRPVRDGELAAMLREAAASAARGGSIDLSAQLIAMANNAIMRMTASALPDHLTETARHCAKEVTELVGSFNIADYISFLHPFDLQGLDRRAHEVHAKFDELLEVLIKKKEEARRRTTTTTTGEVVEAKAKDLLDILMDAAEDDKAEVKLTRENIKAFVLDIFTAGSDTTATTVEWMLAELINHPACMDKLRAELDAVIGKSRLVGEEDVAKLPYLQAVLKETLRLHPPAVFALRETIETVHVHGYTIPTKTTVIFSVYSVGRDPAYWEKSLEFRPERFMPGGASEKVEVNAQNMQLMPFGGGRRACPGMGYAVQVVPAFLAALVQCFDWSVPAPHNMVAPPLNMDEKKGLVSARLQPLVLNPTPRIRPIPMPASLRL